MTPEGRLAQAAVQPLDFCSQRLIDAPLYATSILQTIMFYCQMSNIQLAAISCMSINYILQYADDGPWKPIWLKPLHNQKSHHPGLSSRLCGLSSFVMLDEIQRKLYELCGYSTSYVT